MGRNSSVYLGDHFTQFIEEQVKTGRYSSASDVIRAGLRVLEDEEMRIEALRAALIHGEESGEPRALDIDAFLEARRAGTRG
jgi:antitoxin ParD1/3/4